MNYNVIEPFLDVLIEVRDQEIMQTEVLGVCTTKVNFFAVAGGRQEWLEIFFRGSPCGRIHFRSEF